MRTDVDFEAIDAVDLTDLTWQTTDQAVCSILDLALEALQAHEVDQCVWSLKKAIEKSSDGKGMNHAIFQLLYRTQLYPEATDVYRKLIAKTETDYLAKVNFCRCLWKIGKSDEAEELCITGLEGTLGKHGSSAYLLLLSDICDDYGRKLESYFYLREYVRVQKRTDSLKKSDRSYWHLSLWSEQLGDLDESKKFAVLGREETPDIGEDWDLRIEEITLTSNLPTSTPEEEKEELDADVQNQDQFEQWFQKGSYWYDAIADDFFFDSDDFLGELLLNGAIWADESTVLFDGFDVEEETLEESLARAETLSGHLHLVPLWPVYLETNEVSIAMTLNRNFLLAWVGKGLEGLLVGVNIKTWDLYHADDRDARFACGAVLNWFLDCSLNVSEHRMFDRMPNKAKEFDRPWETNFLTTWTTTKPFYEELESLRYDSNRKPPRAHRVRGHIRTLIYRRPTDDARENAPAYIRKNMGPTDTFVRAYEKSGDLRTEKLLVHLKTNSNLADFLGADAWER